MERIYERDRRESRRSGAHDSGRRTKHPKKRSEWMDILLFYCLPFVVVNSILFLLVAAKPSITIRIADTKDYRTTVATVTIKCLLPLKEFSSTQEGVPLELEGGEKGQYTAQIVQNGVIEINATCINGMTDTRYEHVNILDDVGPMLGDAYSIEEGVLTLTLEDSQAGLDHQSVHATTPSGATLSPTSIDKQTGTFTFDMNEGSLIVHANDLAGNAMQATFNTHMEVLDPNGMPIDPTLAGYEMSEGDPSKAGAQDGTSAAVIDVQQTEETKAAADPADPLSAAFDVQSQTTAPQPSTAAGQDSQVSIYIDTTTP